MLDYEWGNPSTIMLTGDDPTTQESDPNHQLFDHYPPQTFHESFAIPNPNPNAFSPPNPQHHHFLHGHNPHFSPMYDPRAYGSACASYMPPPPSSSFLSLEQGTAAAGHQTGLMVMPKCEPEMCGGVGLMNRIGLNLGVRTYFSSAEEQDDFVSRLYRRSRPVETGAANFPRCQAEGCNADLTHAKHYHRRHKVCEFHSKASTVIASGLTQRFCQQCSRFHPLSEFDNGKRSCRKRLADHNRRRRKSAQQPNQGQNKSRVYGSRNLSSENLSSSSLDTGAQSHSSVTIAISPPGASFDCFRDRPYHAPPTASSASTSSLFFSRG